MERNELLRAWVDALGSGKYKQAQSRLRRDDGYCCLGVLCEISGVGEWRHTVEDTFCYTCPTRADSFGLPPDVAQLIPGVEGYESELAAANDGGESFVEIAGRIRGLFPDAFAAEPVA